MPKNVFVDDDSLFIYIGLENIQLIKDCKKAQLIRLFIHRVVHLFSSESCHLLLISTVTVSGL